jgi:hypothetical protein
MAYYMNLESLMLLTMTTPLAERIERWATSGKAKSILLHPSDYYVLSSANLIEKISNKYSLEIKCLGGESGLRDWMKEKLRKSHDDEE